MRDTAAVQAAPQCLRALEYANEVRLARADLKRRIAREELATVDIIRTPPWHTEGMSISELLMSQRRWGRARSRRVLLSIGVHEHKPIGELTGRQRAGLIELLSGQPASPAV